MRWPAEKRVRRLEEFSSCGGTMVIASHAAGMLRNLCSRGIWLDKGEIHMEGGIKEVLDAYQDSPSAAAKTPAVAR